MSRDDCPHRSRRQGLTPRDARGPGSGDRLRQEVPLGFGHGCVSHGRLRDHSAPEDAPDEGDAPGDVEDAVPAGVLGQGPAQGQGHDRADVAARERDRGQSGALGGGRPAGPNGVDARVRHALKNVNNLIRISLDLNFIYSSQSGNSSL